MMTTFGKKIGTSFAMAAALVLLSSGAAQALDQKQYSGNICQPFNPPEKVAGQGLYHTAAGIQNSAADKGTRLVYCPFQRDTNSNTNGLQELNVGATLSNGQSGNVVCTAIAVTQFGSIILQVRKSTGTITGSKVIPFGAELNKSVALGSYDLECILPYGGQINSIEYGEP
jgi:hypothetical protein